MRGCVPHPGLLPVRGERHPGRHLPQGAARRQHRLRQQPSVSQEGEEHHPAPRRPTSHLHAHLCDAVRHRTPHQGHAPPPHHNPLHHLHCRQHPATPPQPPHLRRARPEVQDPAQTAALLQELWACGGTKAHRRRESRTSGG